MASTTATRALLRWHCSWSHRNPSAAGVLGPPPTCKWASGGCMASQHPAMRSPQEQGQGQRGQRHEEQVHAGAAQSARHGAAPRCRRCCDCQRHREALRCRACAWRQPMGGLRCLASSSTCAQHAALGSAKGARAALSGAASAAAQWVRGARGVARSHAERCQQRHHGQVVCNHSPCTGHRVDLMRPAYALADQWQGLQPSKCLPGDCLQAAWSPAALGKRRWPPHQQRQDRLLKDGARPAGGGPARTERTRQEAGRQRQRLCNGCKVDTARGQGGTAGGTAKIRSQARAKRDAVPPPHRRSIHQ